MKKQTRVQKPQIRKWPLINAPYKTVTRHGKAFGRPWLAQEIYQGNPQEIASIAEKLRKAGVLVPEHRPHGKFILYSRLGSRKKPLLRMNLFYSLTKYFEAIESGQKPQASRINALLKSAARAIGVSHANGVSLYHPHFGNIVVAGRRAGIVDLKYARIAKIPWDSPIFVFRELNQDFKHICKSWVYLFPEENRTRKRVIKREVAFVHDLISHYPMSPENKAELERIVMSNFKYWHTQEGHLELA